MAVDSSKIWFTADTHFNHPHVIRYMDRPFETIEQHDQQLIQNWNSCVQRGDNVFHLGDFGFGKSDKLEKIVRELNGNIYLIKGNHDRIKGELVDKFQIYKDLYNLKVQDSGAPSGTQNIILCHYAMRTWNKMHYGAWQLYGHSHGSLQDDPNLLSMDVGVDVAAEMFQKVGEINPPECYRPFSYNEIKEIVTRKSFVPIDHHV